MTILTDKNHDNSDEMWHEYHSKKPGSIVHFLHTIKKNLLCKLFAKRVLSFSSSTPMTVLELGCGTGSTLHKIHELTQAKCVGVDRNIYCLEEAKKEFGSALVEFKKGDLFNLDLPKKSFDLVYSIGLLEHFNFEDQKKILDLHIQLSKNSVALMVPANSLLMNSILFMNSKVLGRKGAWADEEVFSINLLKQKFPQYHFKAFKDPWVGDMIFWFGGDLSSLKLDS